MPGSETPHTDIFIIGGGINGVGIAAEASDRGLNVILCEQDDLASGTSSSSSKVIHGGLRYLELYDFKLVRKALKEREILLQKAPHIIQPLLFVLPYVPGLRPYWMLRTGLWLYDHLAKRRFLPASHAIKLQADVYGKPLKPSLKKGFIYADCWMDDARLVILNAIAAAERGAMIHTREQVIYSERLDNEWIITTRNSITHQQQLYRSRLLINASGPWVEQNQQYIHGNEALAVKLVKGSHIVVPKLYSHNHAYLLMNSDQRVVFAMPFLNQFTLIGTTELDYYGDPKFARIENSEILYLCEVVNNYFRTQINPKDVIWTYSGVRPLQAQFSNTLSEISRDYQLNWDTPTNQAPLLTIIGGKITTYRELAEQVGNQLHLYFPQAGKAWTANEPLPGGDLPNADLTTFINMTQKNYPCLPKALCERYARTYGTRIAKLLNNISSISDLGKEFGSGLYQKEVEYLISYEWAKTAEDILWRRTKLGLTMDKVSILKLEEYMNSPLPQGEA